MIVATFSLPEYQFYLLNPAGSSGSKGNEASNIGDVYGLTASPPVGGTEPSRWLRSTGYQTQILDNGIGSMWGCNDSGHGVGNLVDAAGFRPWTTSFGFLNGLFSSNLGACNDINNAGVIVGRSNSSSGSNQTATKWVSGIPTALSGLAKGDARASMNTAISPGSLMTIRLPLQDGGHPAAPATSTLGRVLPGTSTMQVI
ncbi:MAG: hypothetical protein HC901_00440 [Bdellovibrionaceae bacterium]|nr:hypothetical protein [Pseudobdellovibrionaceae bacterium]